MAIGYFSSYAAKPFFDENAQPARGLLLRAEHRAHPLFLPGGIEGLEDAHLAHFELLVPATDDAHFVRFGRDAPALEHIAATPLRDPEARIALYQRFQKTPFQKAAPSPPIPRLGTFFEAFADLPSEVYASGIVLNNGKVEYFPLYTHGSTGMTRNDPALNDLRQALRDADIVELSRTDFDTVQRGGTRPLLTVFEPFTLEQARILFRILYPESP